MLDLQQSVANVVLDHSECAEVFQRHRIDFCCRGHLSLAAAAGERAVAIDALIAELDQAIATRRGDRARDPRDLSTPELIAHIVGKHHDYLRRSLPFIRTLAAKVGRVHGAHNPKLPELAVVVEELAETLLPHLDVEEQSLFPSLTAAEPDRAAVSRDLAAMVGEHLAVAALLERARAASDDYTLPDWACGSYRTLFAELAQLERDVFTHVHLENHVLAPRFALD